MIKVPKEVARILKTLGDAGFESYVAGECVLDSLMGRDTYSWDVVTKARYDDLTKLFPEAKVLSEKYSVLREELVEEVLDEDGQVIGEEGFIVDISAYRKKNVGEEQPGEDIFTDNIQEELARRDFTVSAIAMNPYAGASTIADPFEGREDIRKALIKTIAEPGESFRKEPIRMMRAIRYAAQFDFDLSKSVYEAIAANYGLLAGLRPEKIRDEFTDILASKHAGKGLNMLMNTGIIRIILGEECFARLTHREKSDLITLCEGIEKTKQVPERRLGLFYSAIGKKRSLPSIERLGFDEETHQHLVDAVYDMPKLYFTARPQDLKRFIYDRSMDRYEYLLSLEKAQRIAFGYDSETKIRSKIYMLDEIRKNREVIFIEDLAVDANDLIEAGICDETNAQKMLMMLTESTHIKPKQNTREELLRLAKKYKRNKIAAWSRGVSWLR